VTSISRPSGPAISPEEIVDYAERLRQAKIPYVSGGSRNTFGRDPAELKAGTDCSGLVDHFLRHFGVGGLPLANADAQMHWPNGVFVSPKDPSTWRAGEWCFAASRERPILERSVLASFRPKYCWPTARLISPLRRVVTQRGLHAWRL